MQKYKRQQYEQVLSKVIWEECVATPHGRECTRPLRVLAVKCALQPNPVTQPRVHYIHTMIPHLSLDISVPITVTFSWTWQG